MNNKLSMRRRTLTRQMPETELNLYWLASSEPRVIIKFKKITTILEVENKFCQLIDEGWSTQSACARAGINVQNFRRCINFRPRMKMYYLKYRNRPTLKKGKANGKPITEYSRQGNTENNQAGGRDQNQHSENGTSV